MFISAYRYVLKPTRPTNSSVITYKRMSMSISAYRCVQIRTTTCKYVYVGFIDIDILF